MRQWRCVSLLIVMLMGILPVSAFDNARTDRKSFTDGEIDRVVRHWFSLYRQNAPIDRYVALIGDRALEKEVRKQHVELVRNYKRLIPNIESLKTQSQDDGSRLVELEVRWIGKTWDGHEERFDNHISLTLVDDGGSMPKISERRTREAQQARLRGL